MKKATIALALACLIASPAAAVPVFQVDEVQVVGAPYRDDFWTLNITGPITRTVAYTGTAADESGANTFNMLTGWAAAINTDTIMGGFLTAAVFTGGIMTLTADIANTAFSSSVSVVEDCDCNFNEDPDLSVSVRTTTSVPVPEPATLAVFAIGLASLASLRRRRRRAG